MVSKVKATGLCRSGWQGWMSHDSDIELPYEPGHELAGTIVELGSNIKNFKIGDRVTVPFVGGCGHCEQFDSGNHQVCNNQFQTGFTRWGSFAEYVEIKYADINLVKLPEEMSFDTAASLGCRFIRSYCALVHQGAVKADDSVEIYGCVGVGRSAIMIAKAYRAKVIGLDINDNVSSLAKSIGADF